MPKKPKPFKNLRAHFYAGPTKNKRGIVKPRIARNKRKR